MQFDWALCVGLIAIAVGIIAVAVALYFGLRDLPKNLNATLSDIRDKVSTIDLNMKNTWDLLTAQQYRTGTIERNLKNLGKTKISAFPQADITVYVIESERPILQGGLIVKLSKGTSLEDQERKMFNGIIPGINTPEANRLVVHVPCTEPKLCTDYISILLKWLDTTYYESFHTIKDYEEPIQL